MRTRTHARILFGTLLAILALSAACKKPAPQAPPPPPPPPAAPPAQADGESAGISDDHPERRVRHLDLVIDKRDHTEPVARNRQRFRGRHSARDPAGFDHLHNYRHRAGRLGRCQRAHHRQRSSSPAAKGSLNLRMQELFDQEVKDAYFDYDKADIRADARDALSQTAQFLRSYPQVKVVIEGHCDERGSTEYNLALGDRRAAAAKQFLVSLGITADRMETVSYGKERPFCTASTEEC